MTGSNFYRVVKNKKGASSEGLHARQSETRSARWLTVGEMRRPLLDEGPHAFLLIFGGEQGVKDPPLEPDSL
jgi:hypothetical protein